MVYYLHENTALLILFFFLHKMSTLLCYQMTETLVTNYQKDCYCEQSHFNI